MRFNTNTVALLGAAILAGASAESVSDDFYPESRYFSWILTSADEKTAAQTLGYDQTKWDQPGSAAIEQKSFDGLSADEQAAAAVFGFNEERWDCHVNHYGDYTWSELQDEGVQEHFTVLGWTHLSWRGDGVDPPNSEIKNWSDLTDQQKGAAKKICYFQETWDEVNLNDWDCMRNHYDDYSWDELAEWGVQPLFETLGWTHESWRGDNTDAPESEGKSWSQLSKVEQKAAGQLCFNRKIWDGPRYPAVRFKLWDNLDSTYKSFAQTLGYTESTWQSLGTAGVEDKSFDDLTASQQTAAKGLGLTEDVWDCYINHYSGYDWSDLYAEGVQAYFSVLGYSADNWNTGPAPDVDSLPWEKLNPAQKSAARGLCYIEETWEDTKLDDWDCSVENFNSYTWEELKEIRVQSYFVLLGWDHDSWRGTTPRPESDAKDWDELTNEEQSAAMHLCFDKEEWQGPSEYFPIYRFSLWSYLEPREKNAAKALSYSKNAWNTPGVAWVESQSFEMLSKDQQDAAKTLGFTQDTWDCWQNHYTDYGWGELEQYGDVQQYYRTLGWTNELWNQSPDLKTPQAPVSEVTEWNKLTNAEREAAESLCFFEETWNTLSLEEWDCAANNYEGYDWDELADEGVQVYYKALGWTKESWEGDKASWPETEGKWWDELNQSQRLAARQICYTQVNWDTQGSSKSKKNGGGIAIGVILVTMAVCVGVAFYIRKKSGATKAPSQLTEMVANEEAVQV